MISRKSLFAERNPRVNSEFLMNGRFTFRQCKMKYCINSSIVWLSVSRCPCSGKRKTSGLFLWAYVWKVCRQLQREKDNFVQITPYSPKITRVESIRYCSQCSGFSPMTSSFLLLANMHIKERTRIPSLRE